MSFCKRMTAFVLCLALVFAAAAQVSASEETPEPLRIVRADRISVRMKEETLVLTFNCAYTAVGELPTVTLTDRNGETRSVDPHKIRQAVYHMDGAAYPQLFIAETFYGGTATVSAGAFQTADGTPSPAVTDQSVQTGYSVFHVFCRSEGVTASNRLLEGKSVTLSFEPDRRTYGTYAADKFLAALWAPYMEYADNDAPVDASFTPQGRGSHTFTARLNDLISDYIPLEVAARYQTFPDVWNQYGSFALHYLFAGLCVFIPVYGIPLGAAGLMGLWYCTVGFWHGLFVRGDEAELFCNHDWDNYDGTKGDRLSRSCSSRKEYQFGSYGL